MQKDNDIKEVNPTTAKGYHNFDRLPGEDPSGKPGTFTIPQLKGKKIDPDPLQNEERPVDTRDEP